MSGDTSKTPRAKELGVYRDLLYYKPKKPEQNWRLKCQIKEALRVHPSYGSIQLSAHLQMNRNKVKRVMNLFGIKAIYPNLLLTTFPTYPNHIWTADFTHVNFENKVVYIATVINTYTRKAEVGKTGWSKCPHLHFMMYPKDQSGY